MLFTYSLFTHGTALQMEVAQDVNGYLKQGWGTNITFNAPQVVWDSNIGWLYPTKSKATWFRLPLCSMVTFGGHSPMLHSVTLLFQTNRCRITDVHVYDGNDKIAMFDWIFGFKGDYLHTGPPANDSNTFVLERPRKVHYGVGVSLCASWDWEDFGDITAGASPGVQPDQIVYPEPVLTVAAGSANFTFEPLELNAGSDTFRSGEKPRSHSPS